MQKKSFAGEIVLITGSINGMEAALVLWDLDGEGNKETSRLAQKTGATQVFVYHCDCSNREEVCEQADKVRKEVGDVTILINNAGILLGEKFCDVSDADFEKTLRVNFFSQTCKAFLPAMMTCNHGHLVSTASAAGLLEITDYYSASKCAVIGMMGAIDSELYHAGRHGVKATVICPYFINTKLPFSWLETDLVLVVLGLAEPELVFPCSSPHGAVFYVGSWQGVDSTLVLWLLLSSAYTAPRLFPTFSPLSGTGWARSWEGTQPGQLTRTDQRDIPDHMTSAQYKAGRKEEGGGVTLGPPRQPLRVLEPCFLRRPDIAWLWEVENKSVFFFCFHAWTFASLCLY
uniref:Uncharacterized protein n=1 Tax=Otus sunia TaxID=257818 RepID=A0A8C8B9E4_9STRI